MSDAPKRPESVAGALGVGAVLLVTLAVAAGVVLQRTKVLDPEETLARWFVPAELPFGLVPVEAARQPNGEILLRLSDPDAPPEAEPVEPSEDESEDEAQGEGARPRFDWSAIPIGEAGTAPTEVLFVTWPLSAARAQIESLFSTGGSGESKSLREQSRGVDPLAGLSPEGGRRVLAGGMLPWGEVEAPYVHERKFEAGGTFVDTLRVNLSRDQDALVMFLRWPRGFPAAPERARELLAALERSAPTAAAR